ncbi:DUF3012 domain-containing protein [Pseudomaricurvus sp. HS19]|uniref:DUF3012 domain-containing protein n=1 Tax=Pseudomaricurvus sp. HS19 TaxID=2692626 RepID=UPI001368BA35|nr:DUF3012 domain-containing protein [Pseudomaricurvus sp. HS19]MYM62526.1 DUF3012 domain-containing protein [Pseudomaricurvus sp. HS19]
MKFRIPLAILAALVLVTGCSPKVGSEAWCDKMKETPNGDWSTNDASAYTKNCIFR